VQRRRDNASIEPQDAYDWGLSFGRHLTQGEELPTRPAPANPLADYFEGHASGPGLWKWRHYFDVYHSRSAPRPSAN
jgi:hypothetical protein